MVKIQSISNIITNSSSEVFMVVNNTNIQKLKELVSDLLMSFNINEPIDNVLKFIPVLYDNYEKAINHMILTGRHNVNYDGWEDDYELKAGKYKKIEGYPVCKSEDEITDDIFNKAAIDFNEHSYQLEELEGYPPVHKIRIEAVKSEYESIAYTINQLINYNYYGIFYC